jgi:hypothetical protein
VLLQDGSGRINASPIDPFDEIADDNQLIEHVYTLIDVDNDGTITVDEAQAALGSGDEDAQLRETLQRFIEQGTTSLTRASFKAMVDQAPRVRGERVQWVNNLKLGGLLAQRLKPGTLTDPLHGLKSMTPGELDAVLRQFADDVKRRLTEKLDQLKRQVGRAESDVDEHINSKFVMDGAFVGRFATLDDFYKGPEARIGAPNPRIQEGMSNEHCVRSNAERYFVSSNYNIFTCPRQEWEFVVCPNRNFHYPHTPIERERWPVGVEWRGHHGRSVIHINDFVQRRDVKERIMKASLQLVEVIAVRLYSGPMFVMVRPLPELFPV